LMRDAAWTSGSIGSAIRGEATTTQTQNSAVDQDGKTQVLVTRNATVDVEKNEALEGERAGEAVFKAVFGSDSEDED